MSTRSYLSDEAKAEMIFAVMVDGEAWHREAVMEQTGLSLNQFRAGWYHLRRSLGAIAVIDNHGIDTTYRLTYGYDDKAADRYRYWQDKGIFARMLSLMLTLGQMSIVARRTDSADGESLIVAMAGVRDAIAAMKGELRRAGVRSGAPIEQIDAWITTAEARGEMTPAIEV